MISTELVSLPGFDVPAIKEQKARKPQVVKEKPLVPPKVQVSIQAEHDRIVKEYGGLPGNFHVVDSLESLGKLAREIAISKEMDFDTETSGLDWTVDYPYCLSLWVNGQGYLINWYHEGLPKIDCEQIRTVLGPYFEDDSVVKSVFNIKFDSLMLANNEPFLKPGYLHYDSSIARWLIDENVPSGQRGLKALCQDKLGLGSGQGYSEQFDKVKWIHIDPLVASYYAIYDAFLHYEFRQWCETELLKTPKVHDRFHKIEMPMCNIYYERETEGFLIDTTFLPELGLKLEGQIEDLKNQMNTMLIAEGITPPLNYSSPDQIGKLLYDDLKMPQEKQPFKKKILKSGKPSKPSTDQKILEKLSSKHPVIPLIIKYKLDCKQKSAYTDAIMERVRYGKVHPSFLTIATKTFRSASNDPSMLNIPAHGDKAMIRNAFIAPEDYYIVAKDFKGQEPRIIASMTGDIEYTNIILEGRDLYSETAAMAYGGHPSDYVKHVKNDELYSKAKAASLAKGFLAKGPKLAETLGVDKSKGFKFAEDYDKRFYGVAKWTQETIAKSRAFGYVEDCVGSRRHLNYNECVEQWQEWALEREANNSPIQSSGSAMSKRAAILCHNHFKKNTYKTNLWFSIHDEILFLVHKEEFWNTLILQEIDYIMENCMNDYLSIKQKVTTEVFPSKWGLIEPLGEPDPTFDPTLETLESITIEQDDSFEPAPQKLLTNWNDVW